MPAPLSIDLRTRIISAYQGKEGSLRQLAKRFKVSLSFVRDLTRRHRELGTIEPKPHGGGAVAWVTVFVKDSGISPEKGKNKKGSRTQNRVKDLSIVLRLLSCGSLGVND